jgi:hypothetical protein
MNGQPMISVSTNARRRGGFIRAAREAGFSIYLKTFQYAVYDEHQHKILQRKTDYTYQELELAGVI